MVTTATPALIVALADTLDCRDYSDQTWRRDALCRGGDVNWWHPPRGEHHRATARVRVVPGARAVFAFALAGGAHDNFGIWGGTSGRERRRARQRGWDAARLLAELDRR